MYFQNFWPNQSHIGNMTCVSRMFDFYRFTRCSPFWFFNPLEYLPVQFCSRFLLWLAKLIFTFPANYFLLALRQSYGWIIFVFSNQVFWFIVEILSFSSCLVDSEYDAYLPVDHSVEAEIWQLFMKLFGKYKIKIKQGHNALCCNNGCFCKTTLVQEAWFRNLTKASLTQDRLVY